MSKRIRIGSRESFSVLGARLWLSGMALMLLVFALAAGADEKRPEYLEFATAGEIPLLMSVPGPQRVVYLTDHRLNPVSITVQENERVAWLSYSGTSSVIVFEREVADAMLCHSLVNFSIEDDELKSGDIKASDLVSFCALKPGRYPYRVVRNDPHSRAKRRMEGVIVVQAKTSP